MDPDATLEKLVALAERMQALADEDVDDRFSNNDVEHLTALVLALDHWMRNGGFVPVRWKEGRVE